MDDGDRLLMRLMRARGRSLVTLGAVALVAVGSAIALPGLLGAAVDAALGVASTRDALYALVAIVVVASLAEMAEEYLSMRITVDAASDLRHDLTAHVLAMGLPGQRRFEPGDLLTRMLQGTIAASSVAPVAVGVATGTLRGLGGLVALAMIDWRLPLVLLVGTPPMLVIGRVFTRRTTDLATEYQEIQGEVAGRFIDAVGGARSIRASGTLDQETRRDLAPLERLRQSGLRMWEARRSLNWQISVASPVLRVAVLVSAGFGVVAGRISPGQVLAVLGYLSLAIGLVRQAAVAAELGMCRGGARRVVEVVDGDLPSRGGGRSLPEGNGRLELRGVRVVVDGRTLLDGVDLVVASGTTAAIVGDSGTGKSTLASVAGGLLEPDEGEVWLDGVALSELRADELRAAVSYAFERPNLLGETVGDAIGYGVEPADPEAVRKAALHARADDFVRRLPEGYATRMTDVRISGGERQRLGLARAAMRQARLVILDDAMSSLDTATEVEVAAALDDALGDVTKLVVAHRSSSAARADVVVWVCEGRVRATGTHAMLWNDPDYRRLFGADDDAGSRGAKAAQGEVEPWQAVR